MFSFADQKNGEAFDHLRLDAAIECINPRAYHTYKDESFMKIIKRLAAAVHRKQLELRVLQRFYLAMSLGCYTEAVDSASDDESDDDVDDDDA